MRALLTDAHAVRAEARQEIGADGLAADVLLGTRGAQRTESAVVVVGARRELAARVDMQVQTLVAVAAVAVPQKEVALGHFAQVVLVQELAALALFAEAAQPMLAHQRVEAAALVAAGVVWVVAAGAADGRVDGATSNGGSRRSWRQVAVGASRAEWARALGAVRAADWSIAGQAVLVGSFEEGREGEGVVGGCTAGTTDEHAGSKATRRCRGGEQGRFVGRGPRAPLDGGHCEGEV